jgi:hypothetical protein
MRMIIFSSRFVSGCMLEMPTPPVFFLLHPNTAFCPFVSFRDCSSVDFCQWASRGRGRRTCIFVIQQQAHLKKMFGGSLLRRMPTDSSSLVRISLCPVGLLASRTCSDTPQLVCVCGQAQELVCRAQLQPLIALRSLPSAGCCEGAP